MPRNKKIFLLFTIIILMFACVPMLPTASAPLPTFDPNSLNTVIVLTSNAAATETQRFAPPTLTPTVTATRTPIPTDTALPTFVFFLSTSTPSLTPTIDASQLSCRIIRQEPANGEVFGPTTKFVATWLIKNTGSVSWLSGETKYRYIGGEKLHINGSYDLTNSVSSGNNVELSVNMKAPKKRGNYSTLWEISIGTYQFCEMYVNITVE